MPTYYARVRAVNRLGASVWSHATTLRTKAGAPAAVTHLRQTGLYTHSARVAWDPDETRGVPVLGYTLATADDDTSSTLRRRDCAPMPLPANEM